MWAKVLSSSYLNEGKCMSVDRKGNVFIAGYFFRSADFDPGVATANMTADGLSSDIFFARYDEGGNFLWARSIGSDNQDMAHGIVLDNVGNIHITGEFSDTVDFDPGPGTVNLIAGIEANIFFAKYSVTPIFIQSISTENYFIDIFPNPSNGIFKIDFADYSQDLKEGIIQIYNLPGEKVYSESIKDSRSHTIRSNLPGGIYLLVFESANEKTVKKIAIQK